MMLQYCVEKKALRGYLCGQGNGNEVFVTDGWDNQNQAFLRGYISPSLFFRFTIRLDINHLKTYGSGKQKDNQLTNYTEVFHISELSFFL